MCLPPPENLRLVKDDIVQWVRESNSLSEFIDSIRRRRRDGMTLHQAMFALRRFDEIIRLDQIPREITSHTLLIDANMMRSISGDDISRLETPGDDTRQVLQ